MTNHNISASPAPEGGAVDGPEDDELPGAFLARVGMDGALWADGFRKMALKLGYSDMDEGWLIGWFCNAVMAGYDHAQRRFDPALATREEAPAKAGEVDEDWIRGLISEAVVMAEDQEREDESDEEICRIAESVLNAIRPYLRAQPQAREDGGDRPIEASWTDGVTHAYVNLSAALSAERQAWRQKLGLRIASVRYLDVEVPPAREESPAEAGEDAIKAACVAWHQAKDENPFNVLYHGAWCGSFPHQTGPERWTFTVPAMKQAVEAYLRAQPPAREDAQPVAWLRAVDEEMVCAHLGVADAEDSFETAKKKLASLIQWNIAVATDPSVGGHPAPDALRVAVEALDAITDLSVNLRHGGPDSMDLHGLSEALSSAIDIAYEALAALQAEQKGGA